MVEIDRALINTLKVIEMNGTKYIGVPEADGDNYTIAMASPCGSLNDASVAEWFTEANLGDLETVRLKGSSGFREKNLPAEIKRTFVEFLAIWDDVKGRAMAAWENRLFMEYLRNR